jgi:hypothetical protein
MNWLCECVDQGREDIQVKNKRTMQSTKINKHKKKPCKWVTLTCAQKHKLTNKAPPSKKKGDWKTKKHENHRTNYATNWMICKHFGHCLQYLQFPTFLTRKQHDANAMNSFQAAFFYLFSVLLQGTNEGFLDHSFLDGSGDYLYESTWPSCKSIKIITQWSLPGAGHLWAISLLVQKFRLTQTSSQEQWAVPSTLHNTCVGPLRLFYLQFKQNKNEKFAVFTVFSWSL